MLSGSMDYLGGGVVREEISSSAGRGLRYRFDAERLEEGEDADESRALFERRIERYAALASAKGKVRVWADIQAYEPGRQLEIAINGRPLFEDNEPTHAKLERVLGFVYWAMRDAAATWGEGFGPLSAKQVFGDDRKLAKRAYCLEPGFGWVRAGDSDRIRRATEEDDVRSLGEFCFEVAANRYDVVGTDKMLRVPFPRGHRVWRFLSDGDEELERLWRQQRCEELVTWVGGRATLSAIEDRMPPRPKGLGTPAAVPAVQPSPAAPVEPVEASIPSAGEVEDQAVASPKSDEKKAPKAKPEAKPKAARKPKPEAKPKPELKARPEPKPKKEKPARPAREPLPWAKIGGAAAVLLAVVALAWGGWQVMKPKPATAEEVQRLELAVAWLGDVAREAGPEGLGAIDGEGFVDEANLARSAMDWKWEELASLEGLESGVEFGDVDPSVWAKPAAGGPIRDASKRLEAAQGVIVGAIDSWRADVSNLGAFVRADLGLEGLGTDLDGVQRGLDVGDEDGAGVGRVLAVWGEGPDAVEGAKALEGVWAREGGGALVADLPSDDAIPVAIRETMVEGATSLLLGEVVGLGKRVADARASSARGSLDQDTRDDLRTDVAGSAIGASAQGTLLALVGSLPIIVGEDPLQEPRRLYDAVADGELNAIDASLASWNQTLPIEDSRLGSAWKSRVNNLVRKHRGDSLDIPALQQAAGDVRTLMDKIREGAVGELEVTEASVGDSEDWLSIQELVRTRRVRVIDGLLLAGEFLEEGEVASALTAGDAMEFESWLSEVDRVVTEVSLLDSGLGAMKLASEHIAQDVENPDRTFSELADGLTPDPATPGGDVAEILEAMAQASGSVLAPAREIADLGRGEQSIEAMRAVLTRALASAEGGGASAEWAVVHAAWTALGAGNAFPEFDRIESDLGLNRRSLVGLRGFADADDGRLDGWNQLGESMWDRGWVRWSENGSGELVAWVEVAEQIMALHPGDDAGIPSVGVAQIEVNKEILVARGDAANGTSGARQRAEDLHKFLQKRSDDGVALSPGVTTALADLRELLDQVKVDEGELDLAPQERIGWTVLDTNTKERLDLSHSASGERLSFVRLRDGNGGDVGQDGKAVFLCTTEMSVGTVAALLDVDALNALRPTWKELADRAGAGSGQGRLVVWDFDGVTLTVPRGVLDDPNNTYMTGTALPSASRDRSWRNSDGSLDMPLQNVGFAAASKLCRAMLGGRLASVREFGFALEIEGRPTELFDAGGRPNGIDWNMRDARFDRQRVNAFNRGVELKISRVLYLDDFAQWTGRNDIPEKANATPWSDHDDGTTFFDPVNRSDRGTTMLHLIGNVGEWVSDDATGEARIIGASALSPPELGFDEPITPPFSRGYGVFDVGFRVALDIEKQEIKTIASADEILEKLNAFSAWIR